MSRQTHPSWGMISWSRPRGNGKRLFGSDIKHDNTISVSIYTASEERSYSRAFRYPRTKILELEMSATQFAEFITSGGLGEGVPCTLRSRQGEGAIPDPPENLNEVDLHIKEQKDALAGVVSGVRDLELAVESILGTSGSIRKSDVKDLRAMIQRLHTEVDSNIPFIARSLSEALEGIVAQGKAEIEAHCIARGVEPKQLESLESKLE